MNIINKISEEVLKEIVPTEEELALSNQVVENLTESLKKRAEKLNIKYTKIEPQGSTGIKQTQLRNDFDIDLFIGLDYNLFKYKYKELSKNQFKKESKKDFLNLCNEWIIKSLDKRTFQNPTLLYAEHPYVSVVYIKDNVQIKIDLVLYFDLELEFIKKKGPKTAVDRSPWHGRFVRDNLSKKQKNEVRLLKQFFKACHSYGDKCAVGKVGFIGYSAELLVYHFGSIEEVLNNFNRLNEIPIDIHGRSKQDLLKIVHFQNDYLIITDPIDPNRNVASAISEKAYKYCRYRIQEFLANPNKEFFEIKPIPLIDFSKSNYQDLSKLFIIECSGKKDDIHYTIYRDKLNSLGDSIKANGEKEFSHDERFGKITFNVYFEEEFNEYNMTIYCEKPNISTSFLRRGPPIQNKSHIKKFKEKNPNYLEKDGYLWTETKRDFSSFLEFLKDFVPSKLPDYIEVKNIANSFSVVNQSGIRAIYILINMVLPFYQ